jgi:hypothetical protein
MRRSALTYLFLFVLPAACGDQAPADYQGEPLAVLQGTLYSGLAEPLPAADLVLGWPDESKIQGNAVPISTFQRVELAPTFPASFSAEIFQPPPETAYHVRPETGATLLGPRFTTAVILLAKHGETVIDTSFDVFHTGPTLAVFNNYMLTYFDSDGELTLRDDQGVIHPLGPVTKGFHLERQDRTYCSNGVDQACLADAMAFAANTGGTITAWDTFRCSMVSEADSAVEVPLSTPITLTVPAPDAPPPAFTPCPPPAN